VSQLIDHSILNESLADLAGAGHWYVGFSGGVDSTALLHLLHEWRRGHDGAPPLTAIHVNHQMQSQSADWENHCAWICQFLRLPLLVEEVCVEAGDHGPEAAARDARYAAFEARLGPGDVLFLGHHLDDQVETFFLRLLRGSGVTGLAAMPARRALGEGQLIRPLLQLSRKQLQDYTFGHGLQCIEDPSNADSGLDRNYLRHQVLPLLEKRWPGYRQTVNRASEHMAGAAASLQAGLETPATHYSAVGDPGFKESLLREQSPEVAALLLRSWLRGAGRKAPDQVALAEFLRQLRQAESGASPRLQTGSYVLRRHLDGIYLTTEPAGVNCAPLPLQPGNTRQVPGVGEVGLEPDVGEGIWLAQDEQLELRWRSGGERCRPVDRDRSTTLKKLLQERHVPHWWRDRVPLFYLGEELLAVGDLWLCHSSRYGDSGRAGERCYRPTWAPIIPAGFD
jgi:tRNA(Ile)-lysidine synthase